MKFKVVIAENMAEDGINVLRYEPDFSVILADAVQERLEKELQNADALVVRSGVKVTRELLSHAPQLKIVGRAGAGVDTIDIDACSERGVVVMRTPGANSNGVVELTVALMLSLVRHIPAADAKMKEGIWAKKALKGTELRGKTLGMVGLGKIGASVAAICHGMGMSVKALVRDKNKVRNPPFQGEYVDSLEELLPHVDFLSLHVPLNEHTRGMIGKDQFAQMKPKAYIINTARGPAIDEQALYDALKEGKIAGAGIDVYSEEPADKNKLKFIELENVIATPHLGATTEESQKNVSRIICENIITALQTGVFLDAVNLPFAISGDKAETYAPYIGLAKRMGQFIGQWHSKQVEKIEITYRFTQNVDITPLLTTAAVEILKTQGIDVSLITAQQVLEENGIELKNKESQNLAYDDSFKIAVVYKDGTNFSARGVITAKSVPQIVEIENTPIQFVPQGLLLGHENKNVPGVVGAIGTLLGNEKINISNLYLSGGEADKHVFGCVAIDRISKEEKANLLEKIDQLENIEHACWLHFD